MKRIYQATGGKVGPDDFFDLSAVPPLPEPAHERAASSGEAA